VDALDQGHRVGCGVALAVGPIQEARQGGLLAGAEVRPEDMARLSPLGHEHINVLGRYSFALADGIAQGELRPLRHPDDGGGLTVGAA
jgi:hypothetical protein